jgi:transcription antitermination factor NusG
MIWHAYKALPRQSLVKIAEDLAEAAKVKDISDLADDIAIPLQTVYELQKLGRKVAATPVKRVAIVPGWVFARAGVLLAHRGIGAPYMDGDRPYRIPAYQIARMMTCAERLAYAGEQVIEYSIGDVVRVSGLDVPVTIEAMADGRYEGTAGSARVTFKESQIAA